jgi:hypothetical protein
MNSLNGITHAIVTTPKDKNNSVVATVSLAFGQKSFINGISYVKGANGKPVWISPPAYLTPPVSPPTVEKNQVGAVFEGDIFIEICKLCSQAVSRVKQQFGKPEWGQTYIVYKDRVEVQLMDVNRLTLVVK